MTNGKRRERFRTEPIKLGLNPPRTKAPRGFEKSGGKGGVQQFRKLRIEKNPAGKSGRRTPVDTRRRQPQRPTNPHNPKSKDPFMRAGIGLGTNDTKIFTRAGMSMDLKKMRKMF